MRGACVGLMASSAIIGCAGAPPRDVPVATTEAEASASPEASRAFPAAPSPVTAAAPSPSANAVDPPESPATAAAPSVSPTGADPADEESGANFSLTPPWILMGEENPNPWGPSSVITCTVRDFPWRVRMATRQRSAAALDAIRHAVVQVDSAAKLGCDQSGTVTVVLYNDPLRRLVGRDHVALSCIAGAGNSLGADDLRGRIEPDHFVPASLRSVVSKMWIDNDPKFGTGSRVRVSSCAEIFKP